MMQVVSSATRPAERSQHATLNKQDSQNFPVTSSSAGHVGGFT